PEISLKEIRDWDYEKLMEMTAKSEYILKLRGVDVNLEYDKDYLNNKSNKEYMDSQNKIKDLNKENIENNYIKSKVYHLISNKFSNTRWDNPEKLKVLRHRNIQKLNMETKYTGLDFFKIDNENDKDNITYSKYIKDKKRDYIRNKDNIINSTHRINSKISDFYANENLK
ncbi:hypothetical protein, partial [Clostridioides difficile]|uniref:hypothetical protein n=1 Tax=Clostridioides difficile TaxID=1496 RepID=UPI003F8D432D